jgi:hypothetical protein
LLPFLLRERDSSAVREDCRHDAISTVIIPGSEFDISTPSVVEAAKRFYEEAGVPANNIEHFEADG